MDELKFNDMEKQLAKEIYNGIKNDLLKYAVKNVINHKYVNSLDDCPERVKVGYFLVARYFYQKLAKGN